MLYAAVSDLCRHGSDPDLRRGIRTLRVDFSKGLAFGIGCDTVADIRQVDCSAHPQLEELDMWWAFSLNAWEECWFVHCSVPIHHMSIIYSSRYHPDIKGNPIPFVQIAAIPAIMGVEVSVPWTVHSERSVSPKIHTESTI